jgi:sugar phosphate permease
MLLFACVAVYITAYIGRLSFTAAQVGILTATGATKADAGLVTTFFYFTYGCGQLVNAFFCRRYKPRPVIAGFADYLRAWFPIETRKTIEKRYAQILKKRASK